MTDYRASLEMITVLAILAVDFRMYPRRFAKTETSGFSVLDATVGLFAINSGITLGVRDPTSSGSITHALRNIITTAVLGAARLVAVKLSGYPEHVGEYGVHWNFFFSLASMNLIVTLISWPIHAILAKLHAATPLVRAKQRQITAALLGAGLLVVHQYFLNEFGLAEWALRKDQAATKLHVLETLPSWMQWFLDKNREGVCSVFAYAGLVFLGECFGSAFFRPLLSLSASTSPLLRPSTLLAQALKPVTFALAGHLAMRVMHGWTVSRVLVTVPYAILCCIIALSSIAALNGLWWLLSLVTYDLPSNSRVEEKKKNQSVPVVAPTVRIIEGSSTNLLATFLIANVLTGGVNFLVNSLTVDDLPAFGILSLYALVLSFVTAMFSRFGLRIKL